MGDAGSLLLDEDVGFSLPCSSNTDSSCEVDFCRDFVRSKFVLDVSKCVRLLGSEPVVRIVLAD